LFFPEQRSKMTVFGPIWPVVYNPAPADRCPLPTAADRCRIAFLGQGRQREQFCPLPTAADRCPNSASHLPRHHGHHAGANLGRTPLRWNAGNSTPESAYLGMTWMICVTWMLGDAWMSFLPGRSHNAQAQRPGSCPGMPGSCPGAYHLPGCSIAAPGCPQPGAYMYPGTCLRAWMPRRLRLDVCPGTQAHTIAQAGAHAGTQAQARAGMMMMTRTGYSHAFHSPVRDRMR
jgi:hypothetical protein